MTLLDAPLFCTWNDLTLLCSGEGICHVSLVKVLHVPRLTRPVHKLTEALPITCTDDTELANSAGMNVRLPTFEQ